jgi:hypothetical protein
MMDMIMISAATWTFYKFATNKGYVTLFAGSVRPMATILSL